MPKHVFISYQHENGDFADNLIYKVKEAGFETWVDSDRLHAGEDWRVEIDQAIKNAIALIVVMTPEAKASEYVTYEWAFAWGAGVKVIPVMYKETALHPRLEALHYLNFTNRNTRPWEALMTVLKNAASDASALSTSPANPPASLQTVHKTKEQWITMAEIFLEQEDYEEALEAFEEALRLGLDAAAYSGKGKALYNLKRYNEALIAYRQAIRLDPKNAVYHNNKGTVLFALGHNYEALAAYEQAIRLKDYNAVYHNNKGNALYYLIRYDEALVAYEDAIRLSPDNAEYRNNRGKVLYLLDRYDEALVAYEDAIHLNPDNAEYHNNKGDVLYYLIRYDKALAAYEQAIHLAPDNAEYHNNKGNALYYLKRYDEALAAYEQAIHLAPNNALYKENKQNALTKLKG